jgi:hypothetical protein
MIGTSLLLLSLILTANYNVSFDLFCSWERGGDGVRADHIAATPHLDHRRHHCPLHLLPLAESEMATAKIFSPCSL